MSASPPQRSMRTGRLLDLGVTRGELAGPRWRAPYRGIRTPQVSSPDEPLQRIYDAADLLPVGGAIGGWAAAYLLGAAEIDGRGRSGREREVIRLVIPPKLHLAPRDHVAYWRSALGPGDVSEVDGVPVTAPLRTAFDLARTRSLEDAVVTLDSLARQLGVPPGAVADFARQHPAYRGSRRVLRAAGLVDPRSRSTGESRLRVLWLMDAGLPRPESNPLVVDRDGQVIAMPDLLDVGTGLVGEYDGGLHRELTAHTADNAREERMEDLGLVVVRATSLDLGVYRAETVRRLQAGYRRAKQSSQGGRSWGWRPSRPSPLDNW
jgi:hypothetical protein